MDQRDSRNASEKTVFALNPSFPPPKTNFVLNFDDDNNELFDFSQFEISPQEEEERQKREREKQEEERRREEELKMQKERTQEARLKREWEKCQRELPPLRIRKKESFEFLEIIKKDDNEFRSELRLLNNLSEYYFESPSTPGVDPRPGFLYSSGSVGVSVFVRVRFFFVSFLF